MEWDGVAHLFSTARPVDFRAGSVQLARMKSRLSFTLLAALALSVPHTPAADWPQWRGPNRNGISAETGIRTNWPAAGPEILWRALVGTGFSSISISQGRVYTMGNTANRDTIWCFDATTGKPIWQHSYTSQLDPRYYEGGPGSTPTVDIRGGAEPARVYTIGKWGDVFCLDAAKGTVLWQRDLRQDGIKPNEWGFAGSPLVYGELVILNAGDAGMALDRNTGRTVWSGGTNATGYSSPTLCKAGGQESLLMFAVKHFVALEPKTGRELWRLTWETGYDINAPDPVLFGDRILISTYSRGCALLAVKDGKPVAVYENKSLNNHLSPGILLGEHLYAFNGEAKHTTDFRCFHLPSGELKWTRNNPAFGSLILADGKLIILSEKGELLLAEPSPAEFKPLARAQVLGGLCWVPPALANGRLYVRNAKGDLVCLGLRTKR